MPRIDVGMAEIMGICMGDGCISITDRYKEFAVAGDITEEKLYYENRVSTLLNEKLFIPILEKKRETRYYTKSGICGIFVFNDAVVDKLLEWGLKPSPKRDHGVPEPIMNNTDKVKKAFLRGLLDTDGSISFQQNHTSKSDKHYVPRIYMKNVSKELVDQCMKLLKELGFQPRPRTPHKGKRDKNTTYGFVIQKRDDIDKWICDVGFRNPKHLTKIALWRATGECPPYTTISERLDMLKELNADWKELKVNL